MKVEVRFDRMAYAILPKDQQFVVHIEERGRDSSGAISSLGIEVSARMIPTHEDDLPVMRFDLFGESRETHYADGRHMTRYQVEHDGSSTEDFLFGAGWDKV